MLVDATILIWRNMTLNRFGAHLEKYQPATLPAMTRCWQAMQNWVIHKKPNTWYLKKEKN